MWGKQSFDVLFENLVVQPTAAYRQAIGPPVHLDADAFSDLLTRLHNFRKVYPNMAFWQVIDNKSLRITHSDGEKDIFGRKLETLKDFLQSMHPDYVAPYLRWRAVAYDMIMGKEVQMDPLQVAYRQTVPIRLHDGSYYWFASHATIIQVDAENRIATNLQTFYRESRWSTRNQRPFEATVQPANIIDSDLENRLISRLSLQLIDEFTNAELDLLSLYAGGKTANDVLKIKGWSRNTLHEYNANLLKKAKALFVYDFRNARDFAEYCAEKGFIHPKP